ncbi:MAG TPA: NAD(+)/NADH kinase [Eggerthellaceae bacterium]|nr:NAD(+)/NADH kinase [Eggerthellaceae bacterium]
MRVLIVRNNYNPKALESALLLEVYLASQGVEYRAYDTDELRSSLSLNEPEKVDDIDSYDLAVVLGGDGTILRTAAQIKYRRIPILGVNFGHLGFMANSNEDGIIPVVAAALAGELTVEQRTNLIIDVFYEGDENVELEPNSSPTEGSSAQFFALNELVLARGAQGRVIDCRYAVSGEMVADVKGDGIIIATATGSTAYALSAGGPLVAPGYSGLVVVPIAPHSLHSRALVTGPSDVVEVFMDPSSANREATMFIDGEIISSERPVRRVVVRKGEEPTILLRYKAETFYGRTSRVFFGGEVED